MTLSNDDIESVATRVAEILAVQRGKRLVSAAELARILGVSRDWVYQHTEELGGVRLGTVGRGKRPPVRFDVERALADFRTPIEPVRRRPPAQRAATSHQMCVGDLIDYDGAA